MTAAGVSAAMIAAVLVAQSKPTEDLREKHLDMMIDIYLRGFLQELRLTGVLNHNVAEEAFQEALKEGQERFNRYEASFLRLLGRPARWKIARAIYDDLDRKGSLPVFDTPKGLPKASSFDNKIQRPSSSV